MSSEEKVDIVDEHDRVVAQTTRFEVRQRNLRHRAVYILVFNAAGQLFVHRRTATKDIFPAYWDVAVSGMVTAGEDYDTAARRELQEELSVSAPLRRLFPLRYEDKENCVVGMVFSCAAEGPFQLQATEIETGKWMDLDEVIERAQYDPFCPDGIEAFRLYLSKLAAVKR